MVKIKVESIEHLKSLTSEEPKEFILALNHGIFTRKIIFYDADSDMFFVDDLCTGYIADYTIAQLTEETNIVRAIQKGAFYLEVEDEQVAAHMYITEALREGENIDGR